MTWVSHTTVIFCHLPSPWSACFLQLLSEVMPQSRWLHFYFHWEVKPKLLKLPAVVEGYWSLFWTHFAAVFHLSLTAAPEPQMLEVQEKDLCYLLYPLSILDWSFPHSNPWFILHTLRIWKYPHLSNCSMAVFAWGIVWALSWASFSDLLQVRRWVDGLWDSAALWPTHTQRATCQISAFCWKM